eukprot:g14579.t1
MGIKALLVLGQYAISSGHVVLGVRGEEIRDHRVHADATAETVPVLSRSLTPEGDVSEIDAGVVPGMQSYEGCQQRCARATTTTTTTTGEDEAAPASSTEEGCGGIFYRKYAALTVTNTQAFGAGSNAAQVTKLTDGGKLGDLFEWGAGWRCPWVQLDLGNEFIVGSVALSMPASLDRMRKMLLATTLEDRKPPLSSGSVEASIAAAEAARGTDVASRGFATMGYEVFVTTSKAVSTGLCTANQADCTEPCPLRGQAAVAGEAPQSQTGEDAAAATTTTVAAPAASATATTTSAGTSPLTADEFVQCGHAVFGDTEDGFEAGMVHVLPTTGTGGASGSGGASSASDLALTGSDSSGNDDDDDEKTVYLVVGIVAVVLIFVGIGYVVNLNSTLEGGGMHDREEEFEHARYLQQRQEGGFGANGLGKMKGSGKMGGGGKGFGKGKFGGGGGKGFGKKGFGMKGKGWK